MEKMSFRFGILIFSIFLCSIYTLPLTFTPQNGLLVGVLDPKDKILFSLQTESNPTPGINVTSEIDSIIMQNVNISFVIATEYGKYPDATIDLLEGGPGHDYVKVIIFPGPSQGYNYTIKVFGQELANTTEIITLKTVESSKVI